MKNKSLDIRYAGIHGFYWMIFCVVVGYVAVFLSNKGYDNTTIGIVLSVSNILAVFGQPMIASYMDKTTKISLRIFISFTLVVIIALSLILCFMTEASWALIVLLIAIITLLSVLQPFINSLTFAFEKHDIHINFGLARGIGSVAYAVMSLIIGNIIHQFSPSLLPFFYVGLSILTLIFVYTFYLPGHKDEIIHEEVTEKKEQLSFVQFMKKYRSFMLVLLATVLLFFDHNIINNFFNEVINRVGGNSADMGNAIFLAAALELPTMALFAKFRKKIGCRNMLIISAIFFTLKHVLTYFAVNMLMIYIAQALQMFAYAIFIPASVYYVSQLVEASDLVKGQALFTGAMMLSGVFSSLAGGILLDALGVSKVLLVGAVISVLGTVFMIMSVEDVDKNVQES